MPVILSMKANHISLGMGRQLELGVQMKPQMKPQTTTNETIVSVPKLIYSVAFSNESKQYLV